MSPPLNVGFWTRFYRTAEDDDGTYHDALAATDELTERAARLWDWKDLSRGVDFECVRPVLDDLRPRSYLEREPPAAVAALGDHLVDAGALSNATVVTPAFLLHLADSGPADYSTRFPIFDASVWTAFVYLTGRRSGTDSLPVGATTSARRYGEFVSFFDRTIPDDVDGREYERALFRFGSYVGSLPADDVGEIRAHLQDLESAVESYADATGGYLADRNRPDPA